VAWHKELFSPGENLNWNFPGAKKRTMGRSLNCQVRKFRKGGALGLAVLGLELPTCEPFNLIQKARHVLQQYF
jgi:hypothetical protein